MTKFILLTPYTGAKFSMKKDFKKSSVLSKENQGFGKLIYKRKKFKDSAKLWVYYWGLNFIDIIFFICLNILNILSFMGFLKGYWGEINVEKVLH